MAERLNYRDEENNDYRDEQYEEKQVAEIPRYLLGNPDYDPEEGTFGYGLEHYQELPAGLEEVEHYLDHAAEDAAQLDAEAKRGWRSRARRRRKGKFIPPDVRAYQWPVFVRLADLPNRDGG